MLLRIDDIVSGMTKKSSAAAPKPKGKSGIEVDDDQGDNVDSERMLAD